MQKVEDNAGNMVAGNGTVLAASWHMEEEDTFGDNSRDNIDLNEYTSN